MWNARGLPSYHFCARSTSPSASWHPISLKVSPVMVAWQRGRLLPKGAGSWCRCVLRSKHEMEIRTLFKLMSPGARSGCSHLQEFLSFVRSRYRRSAQKLNLGLVLADCGSRFRRHHLRLSARTRTRQESRELGTAVTGCSAGTVTTCSTVADPKTDRSSIQRFLFFWIFLQAYGHKSDHHLHVMCVSPSSSEP